MSNLKILETPSNRLSIAAAELLEDLAKEARAGEIESVILAAFRPNGQWKSCDSGQLSTLEKVGALTVIRNDLISKMDIPK